MENLKIGFVQFDIKWEDSQANLERLDELIRSEDNADLIVLPEMFNTGFSMDPSRIAQKEDGPAVSWMCSVSGELEKTLMGTIAIEENGKFYNRCYIVKDGVIAGKYDKRNLFTMAGEEKVYERGRDQFIFELNGWKIKPLICYDLRFPVWCHNKEEADLMIFMANWPAARVTHWSALLKARAIENQAYVIGVNRVGVDGNGKEHNGYSSVISPMGEIVIEEINTEGYFIETLDKNNISEFRGMFNVLKEAGI